MKTLKALALLTLVVCGYLLMADAPSEESTNRRLQTIQGIAPIITGQPLRDIQTHMELAEPADYLAAIDELNQLSRVKPILFDVYVSYIRNYIQHSPHSNPIQLPAVMRNQLRLYNAIPKDQLNAQNGTLVLHIIDNGNLTA